MWSQRADIHHCWEELFFLSFFHPTVTTLASDCPEKAQNLLWSSFVLKPIFISALQSCSRTETNNRTTKSCRRIHCDILKPNFVDVKGGDPFSSQGQVQDHQPLKLDKIWCKKIWNGRSPLQEGGCKSFINKEIVWSENQLSELKNQWELHRKWKLRREWSQRQEGERNCDQVNFQNHPQPVGFSFNVFLSEWKDDCVKMMEQGSDWRRQQQEMTRVLVTSWSKHMWLL